MLSDIRHRLKDLLAAENTTINRLSGGNGTLQRRLHRQLNEDVSMTVDTLMVFLNAFPGLSAEWVLEGKGVPFPDRIDCPEIHVESDSVRLIGGRVADRFDDECSIPVYSVDASANLDTLQATDSTADYVIGTVRVPNVPRCDGATYVRGDSMFPLLQSGDLIGFKKMPVSPESIFFGDVYLIWLNVEGDRYLTVKYIQPSSKGSEYVTLASANPNYQSKDVHLSAVRMLALVKFTIRMNSMF